MKKVLLWLVIPLVVLLLVGCNQLGQEEPESKTPVAGGSTGETAEANPSGTEAESSEEPPAQVTFESIIAEDLGITTVAPSDWPRIEGDPLLKDAWGSGQYRFVAFHSVPGEDVQSAMAQLLSTTPDQLADGSIEGDYWEEQIGNYAWGMYAIDNPEVGLVQTVSMTAQDGTVYVVSLFVETDQKDTILFPVLENFAIIADDPQSAEIDIVETDETEAETGEESPAGSTDLMNTNWHLTMFDDGTGQFENVLPGMEITAVFAADGRVSGSAGCNDYVSLFEVDGDTLSVSLPAMTRRECAELDGLMLQETSYLGNLTTVAAFQLQDNTLQLVNEAGDVVLVYQMP